MLTPILSTGLSGLVGSRLVELLKKQFPFTNLDLASGIDITHKEAVKETIRKSRAGVLLHLAAFTDVNAAWQQQGDKEGLCYQVNVIGTKHVARYCQQFHKYLIHISTDFVFSGSKNTPYTEIDAPDPIEWYGQTKFMAEEVVKQTGGRWAIVRIAYPFRAHFPQKVDLVRSIIQKLTDKNLPPMFTDHIITPTFIDEIAFALEVFIDKKPQGIYHLVGSSYVSDYQLAQTIAHTFNLDETQIKPGSLKEFLKTVPRPYQKTLKISNQKINKELNLQMSSLDQALKKMKQQINRL